MRICHVVASLAERYGGPSRSVLALARATAQLGHTVELVCTSDDGTEHSEEGGLRISAFPRTGLQPLAASAGLADYLRSLACDVVHSHALWQRPLHYAHHLARRRRVPLITAPRGMMSGWAWEYHRWRKQAASMLIHPRAFEHTTGWHVTSEEEAADVRARGFAQPVCVAPNGVTAPSAEEYSQAQEFWRRLCPAVAEHPTAVFYSRFHQKKRVLELIDLWLARAPHEWILLMVGLPDGYTVQQLDDYVLRSSGGGRIRVFDGTGAPPPYAVGSVFLLPSHSENFGLAIAEAMANSLPVLVTDTTPWGAVNPAGAGWCVSWERYAATLDAALAESRDRLHARGMIARAHALAGYSWTESARRLIEFYGTLG